ncbi:O-antigen ligase family protein [Halanaerobium saccharolyticum]|uniref:O-antigen ligase family protein n=1 Tax=Halanaerobium saccharolyticum TaxID=43595 RepID=UPI003FCD2551
MLKLKEYNYNIITIIPIFMIIVFTPLIVFLKKRILSEVTSLYWVESYNLDFFSYYKMVWLLGWTLILLFFFWREAKKKKLKFRVQFIFLTVYLIMIILSTIFSDFQYVSQIGFPDRYEGMPVLISYLIIMLASYFLINSKKQLEILINGLFISASIIALIGIYQFFGYDFFRSIIGRNLILPEQMSQLAESMTFNFGENIIYSTLYNPNYVGSYFSMLLLLSLVYYLMQVKREKKFLYGFVVSLIFSAWIGSMSRAGMVGGIFAFLFLLIIMYKEIINKWKSVLVLFIILFLIALGMNYQSQGKVFGEFLTFGKETEMALKGGEELDLKINKIITSENNLIYNTKDFKLLVKKENTDQKNNLSFYNGKSNQALDLTRSQNGYIEVENPNFNLLKMRFDAKRNSLLIKYGPKRSVFLINEQGFWIMGLKGGAYRVREANKWGFENKESFATYRGYIWSRSIPLIKDTILVGNGPDTYTFYFPQHDYRGKLNAFNLTTKIVDKPHNFYLQLAINTGLVSLIAVVLLFAYHTIESLMIYLKKDFNSYYDYLGAAAFTAFVAYAAAALFNDSVVSVAPVFWFILGIGVKLNYLNKQRG